jgi:hypothetical protein
MTVRTREVQVTTIASQAFSVQFEVFAAHRLFWTLSWNMHELLARDRDFVPGIGARAMLRRYVDAYLALSKRCASEAAALPRLAAWLAEELSSLWPDADPAFEFPCFQRRPAGV